MDNKSIFRNVKEWINDNQLEAGMLLGSVLCATGFVIGDKLVQPFVESAIRNCYESMYTKGVSDGKTEMIKTLFNNVNITVKEVSENKE